jgi:hypothetical protein
VLYIGKYHLATRKNQQEITKEKRIHQKFTKVTNYKSIATKDQPPNGKTTEELVVERLGLGKSVEPSDAYTKISSYNSKVLIFTIKNLHQTILFSIKLSNTN